jgi:tight adherence protein B
MIEWSILILTFCSTWVAVFTLWMVRERQRRMQERFATLIGMTGGDAQAVLGSRRPSFIGPLLRDSGLVERIQGELWKAGYKIRPTDFLCLIAISGLLAGGVIHLLAHQPLLSLIAGILASAAPVAMLRVGQEKRRARFEAQLPDALGLLAASLRSGYSFLQGLQMISQEMPVPMKEEMQRVLEEVSLGRTIEEALERLVERMPSYDIELLVTAISIQHKVGGNLAELLGTIEETIRQRFQSKMEISALTAEGRLSGVILFLLPLSLVAILWVRSPDYMRTLFEHPAGQVMVLIAITLQAIGGLIIRRMLRVDV